ncbi:rhamnogalacturonan lyase [Bacteroidia bacterium]|nr:rhamnogalacturonan lyase [Bacteroidia bacterium]
MLNTYFYIMKYKTILAIIMSLALMHLSGFAQIPNYSLNIQKEHLGRGLIAYRKAAAGPVYISWRYLNTDATDVGFNIYRSVISSGSEGAKSRLNATPVMKSTFYSYSTTATEAMKFYLREVKDGVESDTDAAVYTLKSVADGGENPYIEIPMQQVNGDTNWKYSPNDASFADLDGDGEMEIVIHRTGESKDNSQSGITDPPVLQAYKLDGAFLWEINLGINIREGAHYTQFLLYDLDGDGKAELVCKTAEGGKDAAGNNLGEAYFPEYKAKYKLTRDYNPNANYRNGNGYILSGPEFLTVFNGQTGEEIVTTEYDPPRYSNPYNGGEEVPVQNPTADNINSRWGDNYGNRVDRFLACVAFLDGIHPSIVMCRGYYTRTVLVAYDFAAGKLTKRWKFDTYNSTENAAYAGQGNHNLRVGDVDGDGFDEIIYGSCTIDQDGKGLYNTKLGHGDALHLTDFIPERPGLEVLACHENKVDGTTLRDAATGEILWQVKSGDDVGRCMGTDIHAGYRGMEMWSPRSGGIINADKWQSITTSTAAVSMNMACWWDGDLLRELQDGTNVTKYENGVATPLLTPAFVSSNNSTKANPCIVGDIIGDWREEVVLRATTNRFIRIYLTDKATNYRFYSFLQDPIYRMGIVYQNVAYNQPAHTGFYFGPDLEAVFVPKKIAISGDEYELDPVFNAVSYLWSTGETTKKIVLKREDYPAGKEYPVYLDMNYWGHVFSDTVYVRFTKGNAIQIPRQGKPVRLLTSAVKDELTLAFNHPGIYNCYVYNLSGVLAMKTTLTVGGKSVQTLDASDLPAGVNAIVVEHEAGTLREKFIKR